MGIFLNCFHEKNIYMLYAITQKRNAIVLYDSIPKSTRKKSEIPIIKKVIPAIKIPTLLRSKTSLLEYIIYFLSNRFFVNFPQIEKTFAPMKLI